MKPGQKPYSGPRRPSQAINLTELQQRFVSELMVDENPTEAARRAGYKPQNANLIARRLLDPNQYPLVVKTVERLRADRDRHVPKTGEQVLQFVHNAMFVNLLDFFEPANDNTGGWTLSEERYRSLPPEVACLITEVNLKETVMESKNGKKVTTRRYYVKLVSKEVMAAIAAKYQLIQKRHVDVAVQLPWTEIAKGKPKTVKEVESEVDEFDKRIIDVYKEDKNSKDTKASQPVVSEGNPVIEPPVGQLLLENKPVVETQEVPTSENAQQKPKNASSSKSAKPKGRSKNARK